MIDLLLEIDRTGRGSYNEEKPDAMLRLLHADDPVMTLGFAAPGSYDRSGFDYPGRAHTAFTCIEWLLAAPGTGAAAAGATARRAWQRNRHAARAGRVAP